MGLIVAVDIDGVVADLHTEWLRRYNVDYNDRLTNEDITEWRITNFVKPECGNKMFDYLRSGNIYKYVQPIPGSRAAVALLRSRGTRVIFVSSCISGTLEAKREWLERYSFLIADRYVQSDFIVCADKHLIRAHVLIDDRPENLEGFRGKQLLFDQPWNRHDSKYARLLRWTDGIDTILRM